MNLLQCSLALGPVSRSNRAAQNNTQMPRFTRRSLVARLMPSDGLDWRVSRLLVTRYESKNLTGMQRPADTYYGIDPVNGVGWMYSAQVWVGLEKFRLPTNAHPRRFYHSLGMSW